MTRIGLEGMEFYAYHGFYPEEQKIGNKYRLDVYVRLKADLRPSEEISDTVNYEDIFKVCREEMSIPRKLLETVVYNIAHQLLESKDVVAGVDVVLKKMGVQLGGKIDQSVIEYTI